MNNRKKSGDKIKTRPSDWNFNGNVHKTFDDHINKSVPLYSETHDLFKS